jgi:hypothetical protein
MAFPPEGTAVAANCDGMLFPRHDEVGGVLNALLVKTSRNVTPFKSPISENHAYRHQAPASLSVRSSDLRWLRKTSDRPSASLYIT